MFPEVTDVANGPGHRRAENPMSKASNRAYGAAWVAAVWVAVLLMVTACAGGEAAVDEAVFITWGSASFCLSDPRVGRDDTAG